MVSQDVENVTNLSRLKKARQFFNYDPRLPGMIANVRCYNALYQNLGNKQKAGTKDRRRATFGGVMSKCSVRRFGHF